MFRALCAHHQEVKIVLYSISECIILIIDQLNAQILVHTNLIICLYMFRALCAQHQEVKIVLYSISECIILITNQLNVQILAL